MRVASALVCGLVLGSGATVAVASWQAGRGTERPDEEDVAAPTTVPVVRQVLEDVEVVSGALTWADEEHPILREGVVTALPIRHGAEIVPGDVLVEIDDRPVVALHMPFPLWRDLEDGDVGADVLRLHEALAEIGVLPGPVAAPLGPGTLRALAEIDPRLGGDTVAAGDIAAVDTTGSVLSAAAVGVGGRVAAGDLGVRRRADRIAVEDGGMAGQYARAGDELRLVDATGVTRWSGVISEVEVDGSRTLLGVADPTSLPDELGAAAIVTATTGGEVLTLPRAAITADPDGGSSIRRSGADGVVEVVRVTTGLCTASLCEVRAGSGADVLLAAGDLVDVP